MSPGLRVGTLIGGQLTETLSLNGNLTVDVLNPDANGSGNDVTIVEFDLACSPLVHVPAGSVELVFGPTLGVTGGVVNVEYSNLVPSNPNAPDVGNTRDTYRGTWRGWIAGVNAGVFARVSRIMSIGALMSFVARTESSGSCTDSGSTSGCTFSTNVPADKVIGIAGAALF